MWLVFILGCHRPEQVIPEDTGPNYPSNPPTDILTASALEEATRRITDIGPRPSGTAAEAEASDEVAAMFQELGLETTLEPFVWEPWLPGTATLTVGETTFIGEALSPSPPMQNFVTTLSSSAIEGMAGLFWSNDASRAEQFVDAQIAGVSAMIRVTEDEDLDGGPLIEVGHTLSGSTLPAVAVDRETGLALQALAGEPITISIDSSSVPNHTSYNVVGRVPGSTNQNIFVVAHYDSWHPSESAFDNALGVGALAVLAKQAAEGPKPLHNLIFLATSGEEQGLKGATAWVTQNEALVASAPLVITLDVLWSMEGHYIVMATDEELRAEALAAASAEGLVEAVDGGFTNLASDHVPFITRSVDAVWCGRWSDRHYHTTGDQLEYLDMTLAAASMRTQWRIIAAHAGIPYDGTVDE